MWEYTPRRLRALLFVLDRREAQEAAARLELEAFAARGDPKKIKAAVKKLRKDV